MKKTPFQLLCFTGLFAIFSSTISKSPVLPLYASYLGAGLSGVGFVASVSAFTGVVASIPAGLLSDRIGRKKMLLFSAVIFSTAPFLYLWTTNLWQLAVVRFYHGFATAIFVPVAMAMVADLFFNERGVKMGWFSTSTLAGRFMAPIVGGGIIGALAFNPGFSYKAVYTVCGLAGVLTLVLAYWLPDAKDGKKGEKPVWPETISSFKAVISNREVIYTSAVEASILFAYGTFETFLPLYSLKIGLSAYDVGIFLSAQVITLALTKPVMGRLSDRYGRPPQIIAGAFIGAACIASFPFLNSFITLLLSSIFFGFSLSVVTSATSAFIADLSGRETHGSAMGILGSIMDIGHTTGPLVSGIVAAYYGFKGSFIAASLILALISFMFWLKVHKKRYALI